MTEKRDKKLSGCLSLSGDQIRSHRIRAHHLDARRGRDFLLEAAGACGLQNSPPGAWETALFNRIDGLSLDALRNELYEEKTLVQAWSFRGAPVVFPASESGIFLHPLAAAPGEEPWIYTRGISAALDFLHMDFEEVFSYVREAAAYLDSHTVTGKEELDQTLASLIGERLPADRRALWDSPSMYGQPDRQTAGGAAVSFLLRPCSFLGLTVFGKRTGASQDFTSYRRWTGSEAAVLPEAEKRLTEKYFHCYGPSTVQEFAKWLGCSPRQAKRLFEKAASALEPVQAGGKTGYILSSDRESFLKGEEACTSRKEGEALLTPRHLLLLGGPRSLSGSRPQGDSSGRESSVAQGMEDRGKPRRCHKRRTHCRNLEDEKAVCRRAEKGVGGVQGRYFHRAFFCPFAGGGKRAFQAGRGVRRIPRVGDRKAYCHRPALRRGFRRLPLPRQLKEAPPPGIPSSSS